MDLEAARERQQRLLQFAMPAGLDGGLPLFAIGIRFTETPHDYRLVIFVTFKKDLTILKRPEILEVLAPFLGEVDIEVTGMLRPVGAPRGGGSRKTFVAGPLRIGDSVGNKKGRRDGTLGFFAKRRSDSACGIVSCNHVIAREDAGKDKEDIIAPARTGTAFALLDKNYPPIFQAGLRQVDAAFAAFNSFPPVAHDASTVDGLALDPTLPSPVALTAVSKVGARTRLRHGILTTFATTPYTIFYGLRKVVFEHALQVKVKQGDPIFCGEGDSGALVYTTATRQPVGLLFARRKAGAEGWLFPMCSVTEELKVDLDVSC